METPQNNQEKEKEKIKKVKEMYETVLALPEVVEALNLLDTLPENLRYHDKNHTLDVIHEAILFAVEDEVSDEVVIQQAIAAAWHDVGYIKQYENNEPVAIELFKLSKAAGNMTAEDIAETIANISDTQMVMKDGVPHLIMQHSTHGYLLDADLSNFGRDDFGEKRLKVAEELRIDLENPVIKKKFFEFALALLRNHEWKTESARRLRQEKKEENIRRVEEELTEEV